MQRLCVSALTLFTLVLGAPTTWAGDGDEVEIGRRIYLEGRLSSGAALEAERAGGTAVSGAQAACANCHRRSGMGAVEGTLLVPPISGHFLFDQEGQNLATLDQRRRKSFNQSHTPYTSESLALAVKNGVGSDGRELNVVMPRFHLSDRDMQALEAYLRQLSSAWSPGVSASSIRFATVITPEVTPERRQALLDVLRSAFVQKNASTVVASRAGGRRHMVTSAELVLGTERTWELDVWQLTGTADTWAAQLAEHYRAHPVFALISGISDDTWAPVHHFCQQEKLPCWFPSVPLPEQDGSPYSIYFSRGLALEADLLAQHLGAQQKKPARVIQVFRTAQVGQVAEQMLAHRLAASGIQVEDRALAEHGDGSLRKALAGVGSKDSVVYWLKAPDVATLSSMLPVGASYFSATLAGAENAPVPPLWKRQARLLYPYALPQDRRTGLAYFHSWMRLRKLPLVDEVLQSEAYFAVNFLTDTLAEMLDNVYRDYLLERAESMLGQREAGKAEQEARERAVLGRAGDLGSHYPSRRSMSDTRDLVAMEASTNRTGTPRGTTSYPHLSLAQGQRFASKGGYIVRFDLSAGKGVVADSEWLAP
ncbi:c-type cytochrome [Ferriphaselus sp. R-1]|uniref:c-type cytochrome n=1 Tax=Ferriphaselus sp. R-1 TaxID=1485544 RepID=UPI0009DF48AB|nr:c-type cytochrome [Ferriphaselus sp. R-1]